MSPGLSVRSEMTPTSISGRVELRPSARSDSLLADGKEPAGLDSTVTLMPSFSAVSPDRRLAADLVGYLALRSPPMELQASKV